jgi:hypothetical protein
MIPLQWRPAGGQQAGGVPGFCRDIVRIGRAARRVIAGSSAAYSHTNIGDDIDPRAPRAGGTVSVYLS